MQTNFMNIVDNFIIKSKNRNVIISRHTKPNIIKSNVSSGFVGSNKTGVVVNYYANDLRYFSFGFLKMLSKITKIPAYYVYNVTDMSNAFYYQSITSKIIEYWDVSNVNNMCGTFYDCKLISTIDSINNCNVSRVTNMHSMFRNSKLYGDIHGIRLWKVKNVKNMSYMFYNSEISGDICGIRNWNVKNLEHAKYMFYGSKITGSVSSIANWKPKIASDSTDTPSICSIYGSISDMFAGSNIVDDIKNTQ